jgi:aminocarboxymuconate-semialdehyde decarboxylase
MRLENTCVDTHSHFYPAEMLGALAAGRTWHGWSAGTDSTGKPTLTCAAGTVAWPSPKASLSWEERIANRADGEHVQIDATMVPAYMFGYDLSTADAVAYCRDVNDELADLESRYPGRVVGLGVLPLQDPDATEAELERAVKDLGLRGFGIGTNVEGANFDEPHIVRSLEAIIDADAAIMMHPNWFDRIASDRLPRYYFGNSFGVPLEAGLAIMSIAYSGLLDRKPLARIGVTHGGGWLPYGIGRLLLRTGQGRDDEAKLQEPADVYLRRFYYDCLLHDEYSLEFLARRVGPDKIMIGTDYPYQGDIPGGAINWIRGAAFLSTREKEMICGGNAHRFLKIDRTAAAHA